MDAGMLRAMYTLFMFLAFVGIVWWAWSARRKNDFDEAAALALEDDAPASLRGDSAAKGANPS